VPDDLCSARETQAVVALSVDETQAASGRRCSQTLEWSLLRTERLRDFQQLCTVLLPAWLQPPHDRSIPRALQLRQWLAAPGSRTPEVHGFHGQLAHAGFAWL
jgi:hypothetical protein